MEKYKVEIGQIRREWRGWDGYDEFFEAEEWASFKTIEEYREEVRVLKSQGYVIYNQDDFKTQFICE
ncbi:MAG: hypothetical protein EOM23_01615 [Candidatus Moranbacteria bacterium]|nr:hypothetical protein [Candidatus Moranbacteria bacterium]